MASGERLDKTCFPDFLVTDNGHSIFARTFPVCDWSRRAGFPQLEIELSGPKLRLSDKGQSVVVDVGHCEIPKQNAALGFRIGTQSGESDMARAGRCWLFAFFLPRLCASFWKSKPAIPLGGIACDDGWTVVRPEWINDDYCDCADGLDEALTSACATVQASARMLFRCENAGYESRHIALSRVGDSICDCCDGSDEASGLCASTCDAEAALARAEKERAEREREAGLAARAIYVAEWAEEMASRTAQREAAHADKEHAQTVVDELRPRVEAHDAAEAELVAAKRAEAEAAYEAQVDGLFANEQPHVVRMAAVRLATAASDIETLLDVVMHSAGLDDAVTDIIDDVEVLSLGVDAAEVLKAGDFAKYDELCAAIASALKLDSVPPDAAKRVAVETARSAREPLKHNPLHSSLGLADKLVSILPPQNDDEVNIVATDEAQADRAALKAASDQLTDAESRLKKFEETNKHDLGPDMAFGPIQDKCFSTKSGKYEYELCLFAKAKQDYTSIGSFDSWDDDYSVMRYTRGQYCAGFGSREFTVALACGSTEQLLDVAETETCRYAATFKTPAACRP